ncbi:MAG TPA: LysR family transcriptional regulator [Tahibacter sp.]|nr:LysR family transcriptional regulator [Tahibacter sp.]
MPARPRFHLRVLIDEKAALGPGKADLLEAIRDTGSISGAGRRMRMSYRRAWQLIDALNTDFGAPVVETLTGGKGGGGAQLTPLGDEVLTRYRRIEAACADAIASDVAALRKRLVR